MLSIFSSCESTSTQKTETKNTAEVFRHTAPPSQGYKGAHLPLWAKNINVYSVNIRQFTVEGTFKSFKNNHLDRLKKMGVDVISLMPIFPFSEKNKQGSLGNPLAVNYYKAVNAEMGDIKEFKSMVDSIHRAGMKVILDWVPNNTGTDNAWTKDHPDWYLQVNNNSDVAILNYENKAMRDKMIESMLFWVEKMKIDGFRQYGSKNITNKFWQEVKNGLKKYPKLLLLSDDENVSCRNQELIHATNSSSFSNLLLQIMKGKKNANDIAKWYKLDKSSYEKGFHTLSIPSMSDIKTESNNNKIQKLFAVLASTLTGTPLLSSGQEEPITSTIDTFKKDNIDWNSFQDETFYKSLFNLKHRNKGLWNGTYGVETEFLYDANDVLIYRKKNDGHYVIVALNFSSKLQRVPFEHEIDNAIEIFYNRKYTHKPGKKLSIEPYGYLVLSSF